MFFEVFELTEARALTARSMEDLTLEEAFDWAFEATEFTSVARFVSSSLTGEKLSWSLLRYLLPGFPCYLGLVEGWTEEL